ncbi:MAG TPA: class I SAM-dependent methyltransferase [archaeon]|nr:class I SAM-dependent methyltransferase [archaeon]
MKDITTGKFSCRLCSQKYFQSKYFTNNCYIVECNFCGLVQLANNPAPEELGSRYAENYFKHGKYIQDYSALKEQERRLAFLKRCKIKPGAKILDAGCATGDFITAVKNDYQVWGRDISEFAIQEAKRLNPEIKERLSSGPLEELDFSGEEYDVIIMWDVIEHLPDPLSVVKKLKSGLKHGGLLLLSTPNIGAFMARLMGKRWALMTPPEHITFFNRKTITKLLHSCGLEMFEWKTRGKWVNLGFMIYKISRVFPKLVPDPVVNFFKKNRFGRIPIYIPTGDIQYVGARKR